MPSCLGSYSGLGNQVSSPVILLDISNMIVEKILATLLDSLILGNQDKSTQFANLLNHLPTFEQKNVLYSTLQVISREKLSTSIITEADSSWWKSDANLISGAAGLIKSMVSSAESRKTRLLSWLTSSSGAGVGESIAIRRAVVAVIAEDKSDIESLLERSMQQFGDQLYIRHTPTIQQEGNNVSSLLAIISH